MSRMSAARVVRRAAQKIHKARGLRSGIDNYHIVAKMMLEHGPAEVLIHLKTALTGFQCVLEDPSAKSEVERGLRALINAVDQAIDNTKILDRSLERAQCTI